jgi:hypothetical protein
MSKGLCWLFVRLSPAAAIAVGLTGCGARTALLVPEGDSEALEATADVAPGVEVEPPPPPCDPSVTLVYAVTEKNELLTFDPRTRTFSPLGALACPASAGSVARSLGVDRLGHAFVNFSDGALYRLSLRTLACSATAMAGVPAESFGMAFSYDPESGRDRLYVARAPYGAPDHLYELDLLTFALRDVGFFDPAAVESELTGTSDGRLYGFHKGLGTTDTSISLIDRATARLLSTTPLPGVRHGHGWAFAFFGGDFYLFTAPISNAIVTRYRPSDGTFVDVATWPAAITGVGVSTCAPVG